MFSWKAERPSTRYSWPWSHQPGWAEDCWKSGRSGFDPGSGLHQTTSQTGRPLLQSQDSRCYPAEIKFTIFSFEAVGKEGMIESLLRTETSFLTFMNNWFAVVHLYTWKSPDWLSREKSQLSPVPEAEIIIISQTKQFNIYLSSPPPLFKVYSENFCWRHIH